MEKFLNSELISKIPLGLFVVYPVGFLVWNIYLSSFGVFEYDFLQIRFLSTGILSCVVLSPFLLVWELYNKSIRPWRFLTNRAYLLFIIQYIIILLAGGALVIYSRYVFPTVPRFLGGAAPVAASIVGDPEDISFLTNFSISTAPNSEGKESVQTDPVCILYENSEYLLVGAVKWNSDPNIFSGNLERILYLKRDQIRGFQFRGGFVSQINTVSCPVTLFYKI